MLNEQKLSIRTATLGDVGEIASSWEELMKSFRHHKKKGRRLLYRRKKTSEGVYRRFVKKVIRARKSTIFVAEYEGKIAGHVLVEVYSRSPIYVLDKEAYIYEIIVREKYRGRGIGPELLEAAEEWAAEKGARVCLLTIFPENKWAEKIYRREGFKRDYNSMVKILKKK